MIAVKGRMTTARLATGARRVAITTMVAISQATSEAALKMPRLMPLAVTSMG